jgi:hypothetical protein
MRTRRVEPPVKWPLAPLLGLAPSAPRASPFARRRSRHLAHGRRAPERAASGGCAMGRGVRVAGDSQQLAAALAEIADNELLDFLNSRVRQQQAIRMRIPCD